MPLTLYKGFEYAPKLRDNGTRESDDQILRYDLVQYKLTEVIAKKAPGINAFPYIGREGFEPSL
jgi:hypothetical protein